MAMKRHPPQRWGWASSNRPTGLRVVAAWTPGESHSTTLSSAPTLGAGYPVSSRPLARRPSTAAGCGLPQTPAASAWQTPRTDSARRGHSCAQSCRLDFSVYCTFHFQSSTAPVQPASVCRRCVYSLAGPSPNCSVRPCPDQFPSTR